ITGVPLALSPHSVELILVVQLAGGVEGVVLEVRDDVNGLPALTLGGVEIGGGTDRAGRHHDVTDAVAPVLEDRLRGATLLGRDIAVEPVLAPARDAGRSE